MSRLRILTQKHMDTLTKASEHLSSLKAILDLQKGAGIKIKFYQIALSEDFPRLQGKHEATTKRKETTEVIALFKNEEIQMFRSSEHLEYAPGVSLNTDHPSILDQLIKKKVNLAGITYLIKLEADHIEGRYSVTFYYNDFPQIKKLLMSKIKKEANQLINKMVGKE